MEKVIKLISQLVTISKEYWKNVQGVTFTSNVNNSVLNFLRHIHYGKLGVNKTTSKKIDLPIDSWDIVLGPLDSSFINFVINSKPKFLEDLNDYIGKSKDNPSKKDIKFNNMLIDLPHLAATIEGYIASITPDFWTGCGGDLSTLIGEITYKCANNKYNKAYKLLAINSVDTDGPTTFGNADFYSDIDAIYISQKLNNNFLDDIYKYYINKEYVNRKNIIINDIEYSGELSDRIYEKLTGSSGFKFLAIAGLQLKNLTKKYYDGEISHLVDYDEESVKACCQALAKRINELGDNGILNF